MVLFWHIPWESWNPKLSLGISIPNLGSFQSPSLHWLRKDVHRESKFIYDIAKKSPTITNQEKSLITYQTAFPVCFIVFFHLYMTWISASVLAVSLDAFVIWKKVALDAARQALDHLRSGPVKNITVTFHRTLTMKNDDFMGVNFF